MAEHKEHGLHNMNLLAQPFYMIHAENHSPGFTNPSSLTPQPPKPTHDAKEEHEELDLHAYFNRQMFCPTQRLQPLWQASAANFTGTNGVERQRGQC